MGAILFSQVTTDRPIGNGLKLHLGNKKNFFSERVVIHRSRMPRKSLSSLEIFENCVDTVLRDVV